MGGISFACCFRDSTSASLVMSLVPRIHEAYRYSQTKDFTLFSAVFGFFCFLTELNWIVNQVSREIKHLNMYFCTNLDIKYVSVIRAAFCGWIYSEEEEDTVWRKQEAFT